MRARVGGERFLPLWFGVLAGPLAWTAQLLLSYLLDALSCRGGLGDVRLLLHAVTLLTALVALWGIRVAWVRWRGAPTDLDPPPGRVHAMGMAGVALGAIFLTAIVAGGIPSLVLPPCA